ncbi:capsule biosynthesis protein [Basilea psittacipulmonis DSM 24701]|uniref:Capsule biosynthesis protein n=2 Tax=Basilea TaxID=1472344 RepID=A0A077DDT4_9BURK|nr:capsule biosynthesis protein [Basilea psittacipulmonis DSM 24701]
MNMLDIASLRKKIKPLFCWIVIVPTFFSLIYFSFWASDIYISESSFVVRSARNQTSLTGIGALLQNVGISRSQDDAYTVQEFIRSRTAVDRLVQLLPIKSYYEDQGDLLKRFNSFGLNHEDESFYQYFLNFQSIYLDPLSGIATLKIRAFKAEEAQKINRALLDEAEQLINRLNERARQDTIKSAEKTVKDAEQHVNETAQELTQYRIKHAVVDVKAQSELLLNLISGLQSELINTQSQLAQIKSISPNNPQVRTLTIREQSIQKEIDKQLQLIVGNESSLATQTAEYQRLVLNNTLAQQELTTAIASLQQAKIEADRKQLYLEVIAQPSKPDLALEPYRIYNILATLFFSLLIYGIIRLLIASIREHRN